MIELIGPPMRTRRRAWSLLRGGRQYQQRKLTVPMAMAASTPSRWGESRSHLSTGHRRTHKNRDSVMHVTSGRRSAKIRDDLDFRLRGLQNMITRKLGA